MLDWYEHLYVSKEMKKKEKRVRMLIDRGRDVPGVYLLTLSGHPDNILEMIRASFLTQKALHRQCPRVVGIASGRDNALALLVQIVEETFENTGNFRVEEYLRDR